MLEEFIQQRRHDIVARARTRISARIAPRPTQSELDVGLSLFLDELLRMLAPSSAVLPTPVRAAMLQQGFTVAQVVYDYGDICQAVTELVDEAGTTITALEFRVLNQCLDDAIAAAVTEFSRRRELATREGETARLTALAGELSGPLSAATLSFEIVQRGTVGVGGSTGALVARSLARARRIVDRALALAGVSGSSLLLERVELAELVEELELAAMIEARGRGVSLTTARALGASTIADRAVLAAALQNILLDAVQRTPRGGDVVLRILDGGPMLRFEVEDGSGAQPDELAVHVASPPSAQLGGRALGLAIAREAVEAGGGRLSVHAAADAAGCIVVVELPAAN